MDKNFSKWIEIASFGAVMHPKYAITPALMFELTENKKTYTLKLKGCSTYSEDNTDWTNTECAFGQLKKVTDLEVKKKVAGETPEQAVSYFANMIKEYIANGTNKQAFLVKSAVAVGFVGGNVQIVYKKPAPQPKQ